jgi:hypothetical protein
MEKISMANGQKPKRKNLKKIKKPAIQMRNT